LYIGSTTGESKTHQNKQGKTGGKRHRKFTGSFPRKKQFAYRSSKESEQGQHSGGEARNCQTYETTPDRKKKSPHLPALRTGKKSGRKKRRILQKGTREKRGSRLPETFFKKESPAKHEKKKMKKVWNPTRTAIS